MELDVVLEDVDGLDDVSDLSIVLACSSNSFIEAVSDTSSSLPFVELVGDEVSSPSAFWIFGFCGDWSFLSFGRGQLGDMWSGQPQFQHLLFSSFWSCDQLHIFPLLHPCSDRKNLHLPFSSFCSSFFVGDLPSSSSFFSLDTFAFSGSTRFFDALEVS